MQFLQRSARALGAYGPTSSLHGLYHFYQSNDAKRRVMWLIILLAAMGVGTYHLVQSTKRYLSKDIFVHVSDEATEAIFPEVTLCNSKPFGESLLVYYSDVVDKHFRDRWGYFNNWFVQERKQRPKESDIDYRSRLKAIFSRFLDVVWISEDAKDLGMADSVSILKCSYEGEDCSHSFTLVRDPEDWNCYNFVPDRRLTVGTLGLTLVLFTDSNFFHPIHDGSMLSLSNRSLLSYPNTTDLSKLNSLKYFLSTRLRSLNQISAPNMFQSDGFRVIVHDPESHPMMSLHRLEFESGVTATITIDQMIMKRLQRSGNFYCVQPPYKKVAYVTDFDSKDTLKYRTYNKLLDDHVVEEKQKMVYSACGCYSHKYPFVNSSRSLCYYVPQSQRMVPSEELMNRIDCHNRAVVDADRATNNLVNEFNTAAPCDSMLLTFAINVFGWPKNEDVAEMANTYIVQKYINDTDFFPKGDDNEHGIFNFTNSEILKMLGNRTANRKMAVLSLLLSQDCASDPSEKAKAKAMGIANFWCLASNERLRRNVLKLNIKHKRIKSRQAKEHYSYHWPEALSELGGACGLWLGMSVLTLCELLEVAYILLFTVEVEPPNRTIEHEMSTLTAAHLTVANNDLDSEG